MLRHRCTGLLLFTLLCLHGNYLSAQSPETLLENGEYAAAAAAFTARGTRADHFAAGKAWDTINRVDEAVAAYRRVIEGQAPDSLAGLAQHRIGLAYYLDYQEPAAITAYRKAVEIRDAVFAGQHKDRAHSRLNLAQTLIEVGQNDTAQIVLQQAIDIYASAQPTDSLNWTRALNSLALLAEDARDYQVGVNAVRQATAMITELSAPEPLDVFDTWYAAGRTYLAFADLRSARQAAEKSLVAAKATGYADVLVQSLTMLAGIEIKEEHYTESLDLNAQALTLCEGLGMPETELGVLHFNLALAYGKLNNIRQALYHSEQATPLLRDDAYFYPRLLDITGDIYRRAEDFRTALDTFNAGVASVAGLNGNALHYPDPANMEPAELEILAELLGDRADVLESLDQPQEALQDYQLLFAVQDNLRSRVTSDESRQYLSQNLRKFFDRAINLEFRNYTQHQDQATAWRAFLLSERAKAYSLLTAIQRDRATMPQREAVLRARIASLERSTRPGDPEEQLLAAARLQLDRLLRLADDKENQQISAFDQEKLEAFVREQQTGLLAYHLGSDRGYRWLLRTDGTLTFDSIGEARQLPSTIDNWRAAITTSAYRRKSLRAPQEQQALDAQFMDTGRQLHQWLIGELELPGQVCVLPDGPLTVLPFGALPTEAATPPLAYGSVAYLQTETALHYAYSARIWQELTEKTGATYDKNLLAFAPTFRGSAPANTLTRAVDLRDGERALTGLSPLQHNRPEVEEITALVPRSTAFYGADADRRHFLDNLAGARIIHLSTHGVVNAAHPTLSFVAFSQLRDSLEYEEMLYYNDLAALPISAELAVLSACETSLGAYVPGETSLSLASAFTAAGARSTLTTLWQVDDAATKELMLRFYQELVAGKDRVGALQAAQQTHLTDGEYAHPFYWSATTLYGAAGPLPLESGGLSMLYLFVAVLGLLVMFLFLRNRHKG